MIYCHLSAFVYGLQKNLYIIIVWHINAGINTNIPINDQQILHFKH